VERPADLLGKRMTLILVPSKVAATPAAGEPVQKGSNPSGLNIELKTKA